MRKAHRNNKTKEKTMTKNTIIPNIITAAVVGCAAICLVAYILAPERTRSGDYANPIKYFTSAEYRCENFGEDCIGLYKGCTTNASCSCMGILDGKVSHNRAVRICK